MSITRPEYRIKMGTYTEGQCSKGDQQKKASAINVHARSGTTRFVLYPKANGTESIASKRRKLLS